jgi:hypothetical protein
MDVWLGLKQWAGSPCRLQYCLLVQKNISHAFYLSLQGYAFYLESGRDGGRRGRREKDGREEKQSGEGEEKGPEMAAINIRVSFIKMSCSFIRLDQL